MKITKLSEQLKNPDRVNIFVDGKYGFSLTINQVLETKIKVGQEISDSDLGLYKKMSTDGKLKAQTLEWLTIRPRSAKELADYLKKKKLDSETAQGWIAEFQKKNYQDDAAFSRWWADQRRRKNKSASFIKYELRTKGVKDDDITAALESGDISDIEALKNLIIKKRLAAKYQDDRKLTEYLLRQGYNYSLIKDALTE